MTNKKKNRWNLSKKMQQNLHNEHNFLKHTIIYPHYDNSMIQNFLKTKILKNTVILFRHHKTIS